MIAHREYGFTTNLPLEVMLEDNVLLAWRYNGDYRARFTLPGAHVGPQRYFWKSAKWAAGA